MIEGRRRGRLHSGLTPVCIETGYRMNYIAIFQGETSLSCRKLEIPRTETVSAIGELEIPTTGLFQHFHVLIDTGTRGLLSY